jgi:hypothetical protein
MWRWFRWIVLGMGILAIGFFIYAFLPISFYLPHEKPLLILPFDPKYDPLCRIMPMGEKINHPDAPSGHPGIDFGFDGVTEKVPYLASMNGKITKVRIYANPEQTQPGKTPLSKKMADIVIVNGPYQTVYAELDGESLPSSIHVGGRIKQGDLVGYGNLSAGQEPGVFREMIHWEFGSTSPLIDRFCPLTYFTPESEARIESIWAQTDWPEMKAQYPKLCNGDYEGKAEKLTPTP